MVLSADGVLFIFPVQCCLRSGTTVVCRRMREAHMPTKASTSSVFCWHCNLVTTYVVDVNVALAW